MLKKIFIFILCLLKFVASDELVCNFIQHLDGYNCETLSSFKDKITSVSGRHLTNRSNTDVEVFFAPQRSQVKDVPTGACLVFENLVKFDVNGQYVDDLSRTIFDGCIKVQQVKIMYTKMREFDEKLLYDLVSLESLMISESSLEHLQRDFLKNNRVLKTLDLSYNKLTSISTIIPPSVMNINLYNNPCIDRTLYPNDFHRIHELCPDENKMLSLNLTDAMNKFQSLHLLIMKITAKLDDFHAVSDSAFTEIDDRLKIAEQQADFAENKSKNNERDAFEKSKVIEDLKSDLSNLALSISKQNEEIDRIKEQQAENIEKIKDQVTKMQERVNNFSTDRSKLDNILEQNALQANFNADRKFIYLGFAMNALMFAVFILFAFIKMTRPTKRDAMLLSAFDS
jgi:hypothetical protein